MEHPPSCRQKLPALFHGLTSYKNSYQLSAISFQPKEKPQADRDHPHVEYALRTMVWGKNSRERLFHIYLAKE